MNFSPDWNRTSRPRFAAVQQEVVLEHQQVRDLIAMHFGVPADTVRDDCRFREDLGADSLDLVELTMLLETTLDITLTHEESEAIASVGDALEMLQRQTAACMEC